MKFWKIFLALYTLTVIIFSNSPVLANGNGSWVDEENYYRVSVPRGRDLLRDEEDSQYRSEKRAPRRLAPKAAAFRPGSNNLALEVGQTFLMGDLSRYENSLGYNLRYTYGVSNMFAFDSSLGFSNHSEGRFSKWHLNGGVRLNLASYDRIIPYLNAGLGFYRPSREIGTDVNLSSTLFGLHAGGGANLLLSKETFFGAQLNYHNIFGSSKLTSSGPVELGGAYVDFLVHAGYTF